eukprot:COSAG01_NODE_48766_length_378_cov_0.745520_1_plen_78_part_01
MCLHCIDLPYRQFVERDELAEAATSALTDERLQRTGVGAVLRRVSAQLEYGSEAALLCAYLGAVLGLPLALACFCLRP